jgi:hypothetical protein
MLPLPGGGRRRLLVALGVALAFGAGPTLGSAAAARAAEPAAPESAAVAASPTVRHGPKGWELETADGSWLLRLDARLQFRVAYPSDTDPVTEEDFRDQDELVFQVNRARLKVGGHAHAPWLQYYWEYELASSNLLDFRLMATRHPFLRLKVGQWKVQYNRERMISSGEQQLVDRSLINRPFTVDRQQGVSVYGTLAGPGLALFDYWASVFTGTGRGAGANDDLQPMWMGRIQWAFLGRPVAFRGSDLEKRDAPAGLLAVATLTNRSPYTRSTTARTASSRR